MTELLDPNVLVDPSEAFLAGGLAQPAAQPPRDPHQVRVALEIAAAVVAMTALVRHRLAQAGAQPDPYPAQARNAWDELAPTWLRLSVPAIRQAYGLGSTKGLTDAELNMLATDYAAKLGDYVSETSAEALNEGMEQQLGQRWSERVAWHRATTAYGLDKRDMRSWMTSLLGRKEGPELVPLAARMAVDKAMLLRADRIGINESYTAQQSGQVVGWIWLARNGRLPAGCGRAWEMGGNEAHCATCNELANQVVPLEEPFVLVSGVKLWAPRAHPGCYCRVRLVQPSEEITKVDTVKAAGIAVVAANTGRVLMLQRAIDPKDPASGTWEFPGGCLEAGELPQAAAEREWAEEVRQRLPKGIWGESWRNGVYVGHAYLVRNEDEVPVHRRGRVTNPDDPDRDEIEAIAWWDPKHLRRNPSVRAELRGSLGKMIPLLSVTRFALRTSRNEIGKADEDHWDVRDSHGRFAHVAEKTQPKVDLDLAPVAAPADPWSETTAFSGRADPWGKADPWAAKDPWKAKAPDPWAGNPWAEKHPTKIVRHHVVLFRSSVAPDEAPDDGKTYYLPADRFHTLTNRDDIGSRYGLGTTIPFDVAASTPRAEIGNPWAMLDSDHIYTESRVSDELRMSGRLDAVWGDVVGPAAECFNDAMERANTIVPRLEDGDVHRIARLAGLEDQEDTDTLRERIGRHVAQRCTGKDDSLAMAYGDYVTWHSASQYLGEDGKELDKQIDALGDPEIGLNLRTFGGRREDPLPVEQVFAFDGGLHDDTRHGQGEAMINGEYATMRHSYRSALGDDGVDAQPLRMGLRVTHVVPFVEGRTGSRRGEIIEG